MSRARYGLLLESFGLVVEFQTDDLRLLELAPRALPVWSIRPAGRGAAEAVVRFSALGDGTLAVNDEQILKVFALPTVIVDVLEVKLRHHLALHAPHHVFIHSGVVALDGVGIVLPGSSFSGKTTLVAELVAQGATYLSDEYAVVDAAGMIHPYPRPLRLRPEPGAGAELTTVPIPEAQLGRDPVRAGLIVVTEHRSGAEWSPQQSTPAEGAIALLSHTVPARSRPERSMSAARAAAEGSLTLTGPRGEAWPTASRLLATARERASAAGQ